MNRRRRRILRVAGLSLLGGVAGCLGGGDSSNGTGEPTDGAGTTDPGGTTADRSTADPGGATETAATTGGNTTPPPASLGTTRTVQGNPVRITETTVRDSVFYLEHPDEFGVKDPGDGRYVFARVGAPDGGPARGEFELAAGDERFYGGLDRSRPWGGDVRPVYGGTDGTSGWVSFWVAAPLEADSVRVEVGDDAWRLPDEDVKALRRPAPTFELQEFAVPDAVEPGQRFDVAATFRNTGDAPGTLRAVMPVHGAGSPCCNGPKRVVEVPAGGRETWRESIGDPDTSLSWGEEVAIRLKYPGGRRERTVSVNGERTTDDG
ncbi:hypothetical protein BRD00_15220 [Halobacteriales archaeon QS_8_69_26]|nr:MAG: hypothetical protein BRD00_15220 [Halobacteriales archaeon QS_8_69_26]